MPNDICGTVAVKKGREALQHMINEASFLCVDLVACPFLFGHYEPYGRINCIVITGAILVLILLISFKMTSSLAQNPSSTCSLLGCKPLRHFVFAGPQKSLESLRARLVGNFMTLVHQYSLFLRSKICCTLYAMKPQLVSSDVFFGL